MKHYHRLIQTIEYPDELLAQMAEAVVFETVVGSRAYGTYRPDSDWDIRGIFVLPRAYYLSLDEPVKQISDETNDTTYYTLHRFIQLASTANPNLIELLFMPDDCVRKMTLLMQRLIERRDLFITRSAYESHIGYAQAQIRRAKGQNKWVNNPQPEERPQREDYCWIVPREGIVIDADSGKIPLPYRPVPIGEHGVDLAECHCAAMEHGGNVHRLYHYGTGAKGVFRGGNLVCESIPLEDEDTRCIGLLIYNRAAFERDLRNHKQYWQWRQERNDARWQNQESGQVDYDAKNMMHTMRLLLSGESILRDGRPIVRFEGEQCRLLLDIRDGRYPYEVLMAMAEENVERLTTLLKQSSLPEATDREEADKLLNELTDLWEEEYA